MPGGDDPNNFPRAFGENSNRPQRVVCGTSDGEGGARDLQRAALNK
jgi:hypothetical protein